MFTHPRTDIDHIARFLAYLHRTFREQPLTRAWFIDLCAADADFLRACMMGGPMSHQGAREAFVDLLLSAVQMHRGAECASYEDEEPATDADRELLEQQQREALLSAAAIASSSASSLAHHGAVALAGATSISASENGSSGAVNESSIAVSPNAMSIGSNTAPSSPMSSPVSASSETAASASSALEAASSSTLPDIGLSFGRKLTSTSEMDTDAALKNSSAADHSQAADQSQVAAPRRPAFRPTTAIARLMRALLNMLDSTAWLRSQHRGYAQFFLLVDGVARMGAEERSFLIRGGAVAAVVAFFADAQRVGGFNVRSQVCILHWVNR